MILKRFKVIKIAIPKKLVMFFVLFAVVFFFLGAQIGVTGGLWGSALFTLATAGILQSLMKIPIFPFALPASWLLIGSLVLMFVGITSYGWMTGFFPGAGLELPPPSAQAPGGPCIVTDELRGKTATLDTNAWDMESNTPYSAAVDLTTNCHIYKNGNSGINYVGPTADTDAASLSGFTVGDTAYLYCVGTSYYTDDIEGQCVDSQRQPLTILAHAVLPEANAQITAYDDSGGTVLDAAVDTDFADYNLTIGANEEASIYVKLKNNVANKMYRFCAWGTTTFYNITSVVPGNVESTYTKSFTPVHMSGVAVETNSTGDTLTSDYVMYKAASPLILSEWDSIKEEFIVTSHTSYDPVDMIGTDGALLNGFAIIAKDCQNSRGSDGKIVMDYYAHNVGEADVGLDETDTSPRGKETGVQVDTI